MRGDEHRVELAKLETSECERIQRACQTRSIDNLGAARGESVDKARQNRRIEKEQVLKIVKVMRSPPRRLLSH